MMVITAKLKKKHLLLIGAAIVAILLLLIRPGNARDKDLSTGSLPGSTNEERVEFLRSFGWDVEDSPAETSSVRVPEEPNEVFLRYNELQKSQGYDLTAHSGKILKRYVYNIKSDSDSSEQLRATLFVYDGNIVGGDVSSTQPGGKMHGFKMP